MLINARCRSHDVHILMCFLFTSILFLCCYFLYINVRIDGDSWFNQDPSSVLKGQGVNGSKSLQCGAVFTEHDYHCNNKQNFRRSIIPIFSNTQYFEGVNTAHT